jgi:hypothetical protein
MMRNRDDESAIVTMQRINEVWLSGKVEDLAPMMHPDVIMAIPGFTGRIQGRNHLLAGFSDFCQNAKIQEFRDYDHETDTIGNVAVITFRYDMAYERSGDRYHATGRDLWVFHREDNAWIAVWRTMLDMQEEPASSAPGRHGSV